MKLENFIGNSGSDIISGLGVNIKLNKKNNSLVTNFYPYFADDDHVNL